MTTTTATARNQTIDARRYSGGKARYSVYKYPVLCPTCKRKLMYVRRTEKVIPIAVIMKANDGTEYTEETRCPACKTYVGIV